MKKSCFIVLILTLSCFYVGRSQNIGVGTSSPAEKLHVAGTFRVDDLQSALAASATTDKMVWVDANGKVYSFPAGAAGKILGVNGAGILAWLDPGLANTLNNGQIWIGDVANTPQPQTLSGDAVVSNTGVVTIQDNAVDGTDITITGESNGSLMYYNGTDWVNLGVGTPGQILTIAGGVPTWVSPPTAPTTGDLTSTTAGVTVTGGTGAVLGAGTTVNVATNALNQNGLVTGPTAANALQAWGTDALGNPGWVSVSSLLPTNDVIAGAGNNAISITSGTNQVIGASDVTINVATNALSQDGVVTGTTAANVNDVWGTNGAGVPAWRDPNSILTTNDVVSSNTAINITNGIGQVVGGSNLTIAAQMNALNQNGFVPGPTAANANQVWATNGAGVPAWQSANNAIIKNDLLAGVANNAVSITNGNGQIVGGLNATVNVATNALNQAGVVTGTTAANANQVWGTNGVGVPGWITPVNDDWHIIGNTGTNSATNFIGTIDNTNFVTRTNNLRRSTVFNDGRIKIGSGTNFAYGLSRMEIEGEGVQPHISYVSDYPSFIMMRHQGTLAAPTSLNNGDNVGEIRWYGYNTSSYYQTARILSYVDGPPVANAIPGSLIFMTNTAGNSVTDEKMIIKNNGNVGIGTFAMGGPLAKLHVFATGANWNLAASNGDFYVGDATYRFKLGVATGGGGAGDVRLSAHGGTNRLFLGGGTNTNVAVVDGTNQRVGVNTFDPNTGLDVVGDIALKTTAATLTGASPNFAVNTTTTPRSYYRVSSPTANFNILSLNNPANAGGTGTVDGRVVTLYNATTFTMTLSNQNAGATAAERIITGTGANLTINAGGTVTLVYNTTDGRWVVKDYSNAAGGSAWNLTGNAGTAPATNFIGTTDNVDMVTRTNNTEKVRVTAAGLMGIGTASSPLTTTYGFEKLKVAGDANINDVELEAIGPGGFGPFVVFAKSNGTYSTGTRTIVNNGDQIGNLQYNAYDGTAYRPVAHIIVRVDGAPGANDVPTSMEFHTSADGAATATERMRITNAGNIGMGAVPDASAQLQVASTSRGVIIPNVALTATNAAGPVTLPATSLMVYNTATAGAGATAVTPGYYYNAGTGAAPNWRRFAEGTTGWNITGNYLTGNGVFGTLSNNLIDFYSNNIFRGRISNTDGEFTWGATASPYTGDALCGVGTAALSFAVNGYSAFNGSGTWGEVLAASTTGFSAVQGVYGGSGAGAGVLGNYNGTNTSNTRAGVFGVCSTPAANAGGAGVYGYNAIASGNQRMGVLGSYNGAAFGIGVHGIGFGGGIITGNFDIAVVGWRANNANYSGYFNGNHVIANGTKTASVPTSKGNQLLYVMESPEVWFEDFGTANLVNGVAKVKLDEMFLETVLIDEEHPIHVFVQVNGECEDVYVVKGMDGFTVKEKNNGKSNVEFSYRIVAKRLHFPDHRFGNDPVWGPGDTHKYSQRAPKRPIDYDEMVKQDMEAKKNWKPTPMPEGFQYLNTPDYKPEFETQRPASSMRTVEPNPGPVPVSLPESIQDTGLAPADSGVKPDMSAKQLK